MSEPKVKQLTPRHLVIERPGQPPITMELFNITADPKAVEQVQPAAPAPGPRKAKAGPRTVEDIRRQVEQIRHRETLEEKRQRIRQESQKLPENPMQRFIREQKEQKPSKAGRVVIAASGARFRRLEELANAQHQAGGPRHRKG